MKLIRTEGYVIPLGLCVCAWASLAQTPGTFTATGNLRTGRFHHTATLLPNGKVLIAGGAYSTPPIPTTPFFDSLASAELYDPSTGTFTPTGDMSTHRTLHTAVLLANGKVLIVGGSYSAGAELYDPATGTFSPTGDMILARTNPSTAILLNDGTVLIAGGGLGSFALTDAERYDPLSGIFTATGSLNQSRYAAVATMLSDGRVLIDGGVVPPDKDVSEIYDPATASFALAGAGVYAYGDSPVNAALLNSGKVLEILGPTCDDPCNDSRDAVLYDPLAGTFTATGSSTSTRELIDGYDTATAALPDGTVLIAGDGLGELFDPASSTFTSTVRMNTFRSGHTATLLADGTVLVAGGQDAAGLIAGTTAEIYNPSGLIPAPALFSLSGDGKGQAAVWNAQTGQVLSADNPASAGDVLAMYTTSLFEGGVIPPRVAIGGQLAEVLYFGDAPGYPGYFQINFRVPAGVAPGSAIPVRLTYLGRPSNTVTIGIN
jgi:hypothetical protein